MEKKDIRDLARHEMVSAVERLGFPAWRARQVFQWVNRHDADGFEAMGNVPLALRKALAGEFRLYRPRVQGVRKAADGVACCLLELFDRARVETVFIPDGERLTICVSSQVGCRFGCLFCASGAAGFARNLTAGEMTAQFALARQESPGMTCNVVFMGMGEPLDNFRALSDALSILVDEDGPALSPRRITVSTCGLVPGVEKLARIDKPPALAVSLHAVEQRLREKFMPVARKYPLGPLLRACREYTRLTGRRLTFEYALVRGVNDSPRDADTLADIALKTGARVNLVHFSPGKSSRLRPSGEKAVDDFRRRLCRKKVRVTRRRLRGADINAACGQLAAKWTNRSIVNGPPSS